MDKCYNMDCDDHDAKAPNGCYFSTGPNKCMGFVSKEKWRAKMIGLGLGKLSDPEYGCTPEGEEGIKMQDENKKGGLPPNDTGCGRMSAKSVLLHKIERCRKELRSLQTLEESIQWENLSVKEEELLWHYFSMSR